MLEVSFNSPQCGWMSIGFDDGRNEFHTTTAHAPHANALPELLRILTDIATKGRNPTGREGVGPEEYVLRWNRDPEEFDFRFVRSEGGSVLFEVYQYASEERDLATRELVFTHLGDVRELCSAFAETFERLYADRETDEFEFNWRQPFPYLEFEEFKSAVNRG
ncbi:MAG: hypothetical protein ACK4S4_01350 [Pyrinomonadaceae bacterium]